MFRKLLVILVGLMLLLIGCTHGETKQHVVKPMPKFVNIPQVETCPPVKFGSEVNLRSLIKDTPKDRRQVWLKEGYVDWDAEALNYPFDTVVIHHTGEPDGKALSPEEISKIEFDRLYLPRYQSSNDDPYVKGLLDLNPGDPRQLIHSGHVVKQVGEESGKETFSSYHFLIEPDGKLKVLLQPLVQIDGIWRVAMVAWHTNDWELNCRSLSICLNGNYDHQQPTVEQYAMLIYLVCHVLKEKINPSLRVIGHCDVRNTHCPGLTWPKWKSLIGAE